MDTIAEIPPVVARAGGFNPIFTAIPFALLLCSSVTFNCFPDASNRVVVVVVTVAPEENGFVSRLDTPSERPEGGGTKLIIFVHKWTIHCFEQITYRCSIDDSADDIIMPSLDKTVENE